jgi:hypothetical protein
MLLSNERFNASQMRIEEISLAELIALRGKKIRSTGKSSRQAELNGKRVKFSGYLASAKYHLVQPEQLLGTFEVEISPSKDGKENFFIWCAPFTESIPVKLPIGAIVDVETTLRKPMFGKLVGDHAAVRQQ